MTEQDAAPALIELDLAGHYVDANTAALMLLGVSLAELRTSAPDRFAIPPPIDVDRGKAQVHWETGGTEPLVGTTGVRRGDGTTIRVGYAIEPGESGFGVRLWLVDGSPHEPTTVHTADEVLRQWRAAERALAELPPGSPEWARTMLEIESLRRQYQEVFRTVDPSSEST
jgi:PAS domain S-box-containing protein